MPAPAAPEDAPIAEVAAVPDPPVEAAPAPAPVEAPAPPEDVHVTLKSEPAGAEVRDGDEVLGATPLALDVPRERLPRALTLQLPGYARAELVVTAEAPAPPAVALTALPLPPKPAAARPAPDRTPSAAARPRPPKQASPGDRPPSDGTKKPQRELDIILER
ncbi:MAG: hypothetical protein H6745_21730 [Deltaproteobacteria bacterium]|nr:hypothetical protein [Deltaproteobacteria bacterium]